MTKVKGNITKSFKKIATKCSQQRGRGGSKTFLNNVKQTAEKVSSDIPKQLFSVNSCGFPNSSLPRQLSMNDRSFRFHVFIFLQEPPQRHKFQDSQNKSSNAHTHGKFQIFTRMESYNSGKFQVTVQFAYMVVYICLNS